jgi:hypothetical protein
LGNTWLEVEDMDIIEQDTTIPLPPLSPDGVPSASDMEIHFYFYFF